MVGGDDPRAAPRAGRRGRARRRPPLLLVAGAGAGGARPPPARDLRAAAGPRRPHRRAAGGDARPRARPPGAARSVLARARQVLACAFFFQPLNWVARRRLREISEMLSDEWAVARTGRPLSLAGCLAEVAGWSVGTPALPVPGMADRPSSLGAAHPPPARRDPLAGEPGAPGLARPPPWGPGDRGRRRRARRLRGPEGNFRQTRKAGGTRRRPG